MFYAQNVNNGRIYAYNKRETCENAVYDNVEPLICINKKAACDIVRHYILNRYAAEPIWAYNAIARELDMLNELEVFNWYSQLRG